MSKLLRVHLVFKNREKELLREISKYCQITGGDETLAAVVRKVKETDEAEPDLFLINSVAYFSAAGKKKKLKQDFLQLLLALQKERYKSQIVLFLPEAKVFAQDLLVNLLKMQIYNFWFVEKITAEEIRQFIFTRRTLAEVEEYLSAKRQELASLQKDDQLKRGKSEKFFWPYHVKSNVLTFWSASDSTLNCALAYLTAFNLAKQGFRVALVETVSTIPVLAGCLGVSHPYFNTSHALSMYQQGNNEFIKNCLNQAEKHLASSFGSEACPHLEHWPDGFYFLPDAQRGDNVSLMEKQEAWPAFVLDLTRFIIFEQGFHFLIFLASGHNVFNQVVLDELTYLKWMTVDLLPTSILFALRERKKEPERVQIIGNAQLASLEQELRELGEAPLLYPPAVFQSDFLHYIYTQDYRKITEESQMFIQQLMERSGVQAPFLKFKKQGLKEKFKGYLPKLWGKK